MVLMKGVVMVIREVIDKIGMNANEMQPSLISWVENNFSNNTSSRDGHQLALLDSNFTGANCVTGQK